jgi:heme/copper-type cytochrome/quinol oxidase subunit 2
MGLITLVLGSAFLITVAITGFVFFVLFVILAVYLYRNWNTIFKKTPSPKTTTEKPVSLSSCSSSIGLGESSNSYISDLQTFAENLKNKLLLPQYKTEYQNTIGLWENIGKKLSQIIPLDFDLTKSDTDIKQNILSALNHFNEITEAWEDSIPFFTSNNEAIREQLAI